MQKLQCAPISKTFFLSNPLTTYFPILSSYLPPIHKQKQKTDKASRITSDKSSSKVSRGSCTFHSPLRPCVQQSWETEAEMWGYGWTDIKRPSADIHLNPAAGFEKLMELLRLISACVGGLSFPFYLPSPPSPNPNAAQCQTLYHTVSQCVISHTCRAGTYAYTDPHFVSYCHKIGNINSRRNLMKLLITSTLTKNTLENSGFKFGLWWMNVWILRTHPWVSHQVLAFMSDGKGLSWSRVYRSKNINAHL